MYIPGTDVKEIKVVSLLGVAKAIATERDSKVLAQVIFEEVRDTDYGGQQFSNDTIFIYSISNDFEDRDRTQELIYNYCKKLDVIEDDGEFGLIYFAVCW